MSIIFLFSLLLLQKKYLLFASIIQFYSVIVTLFPIQV